MGRHNELGRLGEDKAAIYLEQKGFKILARNYRFGRAEVDIIAGNDHLVLFVEVKTRSSYKFGYPEEAVSGKKQKLFGRAAAEFMFQQQLSLDIRFDVISILTSPDKEWTITHLEDAFFNIE